MLSKFNGTSTPKGSYRVKTGDTDCNVNSSRYSLSTALCESIRYQAKSEQNVTVRQDLIPMQGAPRGGCSLHEFCNFCFLVFFTETGCDAVIVPTGLKVLPV